jgi:hypothetical protein
VGVRGRPALATAPPAHGGRPQPAKVWLGDLLAYPAWRAMVYRLSASHRGCLALGYMLKLAADAGHQLELGAVPAASARLAVFAGVAGATLAAALERVAAGDVHAPAVDTFAAMAAASQAACGRRDRAPRGEGRGR